MGEVKYRDALAHIIAINRRKDYAVNEKYMKGEKEHKGRLWRKPVHKYIQDEITDLGIYFDTHMEQMDRAEQLLYEALFPGDELNDVDIMDRVQKAYNILVYGNEDGVEEEDR